MLRKHQLFDTSSAITKSSRIVKFDGMPRHSFLHIELSLGIGNLMQFRLLLSVKNVKDPNIMKNFILVQL